MKCFSSTALFYTDMTHQGKEFTAHIALKWGFDLGENWVVSTDATVYVEKQIL